MRRFARECGAPTGSPGLPMALLLHEYALALRGTLLAEQHAGVLLPQKEEAPPQEYGTALPRCAAEDATVVPPLPPPPPHSAKKSLTPRLDAPREVARGSAAGELAKKSVMNKIVFQLALFNTRALLSLSVCGQLYLRVCGFMHTKNSTCVWEEKSENSNKAETVNKH